jgi:hypothetical protein
VKIVGMALFPPWHVHRGGGQYNLTPKRVVSGGYGFLFYPPRSARGIDLSRLALQSIIVVILAAGVMVTTKKK